MRHDARMELLAFFCRDVAGRHPSKWNLISLCEKSNCQYGFFFLVLAPANQRYSCTIAHVDVFMCCAKHESARHHFSFGPTMANQPLMFAEMHG